MVHGAVTREDLSAHLTLGVHPVTAYAAVQAALGLVKADDQLRASLPAGAHLDEPEGLAAVGDALASLRRALDELTPEAVAEALAGAVLPQTRPLPLAPLAQAAAVTGLAAETRIRLRAGLQTHLAVRVEGSARFITPQRSHDVPADEVTAIAALRGGVTLAAGHLPGMDGVSSLTLAARLLRLGIAVPA
jgi:hypothetical protein